MTRSVSQFWLWGFQNFLFFPLTCSQIWLWGFQKNSTFMFIYPFFWVGGGGGYFGWEIEFLIISPNMC